MWRVNECHNIICEPISEDIQNLDMCEPMGEWYTTVRQAVWKSSQWVNQLRSKTALLDMDIGVDARELWAWLALPELGGYALHYGVHHRQTGEAPDQPPEGPGRRATDMRSSNSHTSLLYIQYRTAISKSIHMISLHVKNSHWREYSKGNINFLISYWPVSVLGGQKICGFCT